jgi:hypothetical protein
MYEGHPAPGSVSGAQRTRPPRSVRRAVGFMYAGAALELLALIVALLTTASLKAGILQGHRDDNPPFTHATELVRTVPLAVGALIAMCLWLWMAWANGQGRPWARVVSAVFFGINTVDLLISWRLLHATPDLIVGGVIWLAGLAALVLICSGDAAPFYDQNPAHG